MIGSRRQGQKMEIVAGNSGKDLQHENAKKEIPIALWAMTANLFRVSRDTGKPGEICAQTVDLVDALALFMKAAKHLPRADGLQAWVRTENKKAPVASLRRGLIHQHLATYEVACWGP
jgi:hypothetical protein